MKDDSIDIDSTKLSPNTNEKEQSKEDMAPVDHYNICYFIFLQYGIGILLPWNAVLTSMPYFSNKVIIK
jgi:hypothetical protein